MGFQGDLDSFGLAAIFQTLTANKQSGTLHVFDKETDRYLVFAQGSIRSVSTGKRQNISLGEILVARGIIDEMTLATALTEQIQNKALLGDTLVQMGGCSQEDIDRTLRFQMEEEIYDLFTWRGANFEFEEHTLDETQLSEDMRVSQVSVNTGGLILEAMRRIDEWGRIAEMIPTIHMIPVIPDDRQDEALFLSLSNEEKRIVSFMNGVNDVDQITRKSCLGRYSVTTFVSRLLQDGNAREASAEEMLASAENLLVQGSLEQAVILQRRILELTPGNIDLRRSHADALEALGEKKEAAHNYNQLAESLCGEQNFDAAAEACAKASSLVPDDPETFERLAELYILSDRPREAGSAWVKTIQFLEKAEKKDLAFRKLQEALQDLPDHEDLNRMYARYLLERGDSKESISIYERLAELAHSHSDREKEITAYRSILRIDGKRSDIQHKLDLLQTTSKERGRRMRNAVLLVLVAALVLGLAAYAVRYEIGARAQIDTAIAEAKTLLADAERGDVVPRKEKLDQALLLLKTAAENLPITGDFESRRDQLEIEITTAQTRANKEYDDLIKAQWLIVKSAQRFHPNYNGTEAEQIEAKLRKLATFKHDTEPKLKAKELIKELDAFDEAKRDKLLVWCNTIRDQSKSSDVRHKAYKELLDLIKVGGVKRLLASEKEPNLLGATLPATVKAVSNTESPLRAKVTVQGMKDTGITPAVLELPIDLNIPVRIGLRGFGDAKGLTLLDRKGVVATSYSQTLRRRIRWTIPLRGAVEQTPVFSADGKLVYAATAAGEVLAVRTDTGKILWPNSGSLVYYNKGIYKTPLQLVGKRVFGLTDNGLLTAFDAQQGRPIWPADIARSPLLGEVCTGYSVTGIKTLKGEAFRAEQLDVLVAAQGKSPLYLVDAVTGKVRWPVGDTQRSKLAEKIGAGSAAPYHHKGGNIFLLGNDGRLHVLLEDGTYVDGKPVINEPTEGTPLFVPNKGKLPALLVAEETVGIHCFDIVSNGPLAIKKRWSCETFVDQRLKSPFLIEKGYLYLGFDGRRIARLDMKTGQHDRTWDIHIQGLDGSVSGQPALQNRRLLIPFRPRTRDGKGGILAIQSTPQGFNTTPVWRINIDKASAVSGVATANPRNGLSHIAFGDNRNLYILTGEE